MEEKTKTNEEMLLAENEMLKKQLKSAYDRMRDNDTVLMLERIKFLFDVLEHKDCFDSDFVITVSDEIKAVLFPKESAEDKKEE